MKTPLLLCILDGLGISSKNEGNAWSHATTPCLDRLNRQSPTSELITHGLRVGLPEGQMGNSEVGHLNIGAGSVVEQWLVRISNGLSKEYLENSQAFNEVFRKCTGKIHLVGLYSDGGVHSHSTHFKTLISALSSMSQSPLCLHLFTDGRDCSPRESINVINDLVSFNEEFENTSICTLSGRFYGMDRDNRWERTEKAYHTIVGNCSTEFTDPVSYIKSNYENDTTDEFIEPAKASTYEGIEQGDIIIFCNFRADRMRQIVNVFSNPEFNEFERSKKFPHQQEYCIGMTQYDARSPLKTLFMPQNIEHHLGSVLAENQLTQVRAAETEKYPHVTYFLSGGNETQLVGEERILASSPRDVTTYDEKPEMSAFELTEKLCSHLKSTPSDCYIVNFANCDMVGHTGDFKAAIKAVETVDSCLQQLLSLVVDEMGGSALVFADHGNAEQMVNYADGSPHTAHTCNPVPLYFVSKNKDQQSWKLSSGGALCDIAPTALEILGLKQPQQMTGRSLLIKES